MLIDNNRVRFFDFVIVLTDYKYTLAANAHTYIHAHTYLDMDIQEYVCFIICVVSTMLIISPGQIKS